MTDLRTAAQQALDYWQQVAWGDAVMADKMDALRDALAEPTGKDSLQVEPVAWVYEDTLPSDYPYDVMWPHSAVRDGVRMFPVFAPPQRKPLSEEEIDRITDQQWAANNHKPVYAAHRVYARAVERAHGIGTEARAAIAKAEGENK